MGSSGTRPRLKSGGLACRDAAWVILKKRADHAGSDLHERNAGIFRPTKEA